MYVFVRASQAGDVNCLVKGEFNNLKSDDGRTLEQLFNEGFALVAMTTLDTFTVLLALRK